MNCVPVSRTGAGSSEAARQVPLFFAATRVARASMPRQEAIAMQTHAAHFQTTTGSAVVSLIRSSAKLLFTSITAGWASN